MLQLPCPTALGGLLSTCGGKEKGFKLSWYVCGNRGATDFIFVGIKFIFSGHNPIHGKIRI